MSCDEMRDFWIRWNDTGMDVGSGKVPGNNLFLTLNDGAVYQFTAVALSTGYGHFGHWEIPINQGNNVCNNNKTNQRKIREMIT